MLFKYHSIALLCLLLASQLSPAQTFVSKEQRTQLIELYTSEGCSSCPPADRWLSKLKSDANLWVNVVPVAFHVDYWNQLGWPDRFSSANFSARQREYKRAGRINAVYTPGFIANGHEWRGWFSRKALPQAAESVGILQVTLSNGQFTAHFSPTETFKKPLTLNLAVLGMNRSTQVKRGENHGRLLKHDFVVLKHAEFKQAQTLRWHGKLPVTDDSGALALAAWVSEFESLIPIQATGGYIDNPARTLSNIAPHKGSSDAQ